MKGQYGLLSNALYESSPHPWLPKEAHTISVFEGSDAKISCILSSLTAHLFKPSQENWTGQKINII